MGLQMVRLNAALSPITSDILGEITTAFHSVMLFTAIYYRKINNILSYAFLYQYLIKPLDTTADVANVSAGGFFQYWSGYLSTNDVVKTDVWNLGIECRHVLLSIEMGFFCPNYALCFTYSHRLSELILHRIMRFDYL